MEIEVKRSLLPSPTPEDPARRVYQVTYFAGGMLPATIYIPEKDWSAETEGKRIRADISRRMESKPERISI